MLIWEQKYLNNRIVRWSDEDAQKNGSELPSSGCQQLISTATQAILLANKSADRHIAIFGTI